MNTFYIFVANNSYIRCLKGCEYCEQREPGDVLL